MNRKKPTAKETNAALKTIRGFVKNLSVENGRSTTAEESMQALKAIEIAKTRLQTELKAESEPIRIIHHLSCTGGTMLTKCIASMPNVVVLNEIDSHSSLGPAPGESHIFTPTDLIALLKQGDPSVSHELISKLSITSIDLLKTEYAAEGRSLVLREHSHGYFLNDEFDQTITTLGKTLEQNMSCRSVLTVRDPVDSYASMVAQGWQNHFSPSTFDEYCRRYLAFLHYYQNYPIIRYEDFLADPMHWMEYICEHLELSFFPDFAKTFSFFRFSGDSGRKGAKLEPRPKRPISESLRTECAKSQQYKKLIEFLDYPPLSELVTQA